MTSQKQNYKRYNITNKRTDMEEWFHEAKYLVTPRHNLKRILIDRGQGKTDENRKIQRKIQITIKHKLQKNATHFKS